MVAHISVISEKAHESWMLVENVYKLYSAPSPCLLYSQVDMCYDIAESVGALILRYSQKKECISSVFYCFENPSIAITLEPLV